MSVDHYVADDYECSEVRLPTHLIFTVAESSGMAGLLFFSHWSMKALGTAYIELDHTTAGGSSTLLFWILFVRSL